MITRRSLLASSLVAGAGLGAFDSARAQQADAFVETLGECGFIGPEEDPEFGAIITGRPGGGQAVGAGASRHEEVARSFRLLFDAHDHRETHLTIAEYFRDIDEANGDPGEARRFYNEEWVGRANPLIVGFFSMTNTKPTSGDETAWCAAFLSFCLYAAGKETKFSALSGAYRTYSTATNSPEPGDVVVFRRVGTLGDQGFGHVGLFYGAEGDRLRVLGGNQGGRSAGSTGGVTERLYPVNGTSLELHSIRRVM